MMKLIFVTTKFKKNKKTLWTSDFYSVQDLQNGALEGVRIESRMRRERISREQQAPS